MMPRSLPDPEVDRLARELAAETGTSVPEAIQNALVHELARIRSERQGDRQRKYYALVEIARQCSALPTLDARTDDDILGYDKNGIPAR